MQLLALLAFCLFVSMTLLASWLMAAAPCPDHWAIKRRSGCG